MGFLHEGHISLLNRSKKENDISVLSIFVNPTQFGVNEDLTAYPRNFKSDYDTAEHAKVDIIFYPSTSEMYPENYATYTEVIGSLTDTLCGVSRPTHFRGVTTVVLKLFNIIHPDKAYFGEKDAQQLAVIKRMAEDLNLDVEIVPCPIIREEDGLAKSSRNTYLTKEEREQATALFSALQYASEHIKKGERNVYILKNEMIKLINTLAPLATIDYIEMVDKSTFTVVQLIEGSILIAMAVKFPNARLIDNISVNV